MISDTLGSVTLDKNSPESATMTEPRSEWRPAERDGTSGETRRLTEPSESRRVSGGMKRGETI